MEPVLLDALTILLAQALPHLLAAGGKAAEKAVEEVGKQAGAGALEKAKTIWGKLQGKVEAKPAAAEAAEDVAREPDDAEAQVALRRQLAKILATDEGLAAEIAELVEAARPSLTVQTIQVRDQGVAASQGGIAAHMVAVGGAVQGNVIVINAAAAPADSRDLWRRLGETEPAPDLTRATDLYLKNLVDRYQYLDIKGLGVSDRVPLRLPLRQMFVPLKARVETPEGETWGRLRLAGRQPAEAEAEAMGHRMSEPRPILDLLGGNDGLIVLGDPGAGKTTFLKFLALALATGQGEALGLGARLPVLLPLSAYANALAEEEIRLDRFIARYWEDRGVDLPLGDMLKAAFRQGGVLLLLDGLDEVRDTGLRNTVVERVIRDCYSAHRGAGNKLVLTSRIIGYREVRPQAKGLAECTLVDFEAEDVESFVDKWTAAIERAAGGTTALAAEEAAREKRELLDAVDRNPGVRSLAANPLLLTILAVMKRQGVTLPERRAELYQTYVETLLRGWNLVRSLAGRSSRDLDTSRR